MSKTMTRRFHMDQRRRTFLLESGKVAAASALMGPALLHADRGGSPPPSHVTFKVEGVVPFPFILALAPPPFDPAPFVAGTMQIRQRATFPTPDGLLTDLHGS